MEIIIFILEARDVLSGSSRQAQHLPRHRSAQKALESTVSPSVLPRPPSHPPLRVPHMLSPLRSHACYRIYDIIHNACDTPWRRPPHAGCPPHTTQHIRQLTCVRVSGCPLPASRRAARAPARTRWRPSLCCSTPNPGGVCPLVATTTHHTVRLPMPK